MADDPRIRSTAQAFGMPRIAFEVRVAGTIDKNTDLSDIEALAMVVSEQATTLLRGVDTDEAALFGLLARLREMGLEILEIRRLAPMTELASDDE